MRATYMKMSARSSWSLAAAALLALAAGAGCSDDDTDGPGLEAGVAGDGPVHNLDEEGCEHMAEGPFVDVGAGGGPATAETIAADHKAYRVALPAGEAGFVQYAADEAGELVLFLDVDAPVAVQDDGGETVELEESVASVAACDQIEGKHTVDLEAIGTYFIKLGPVSGDQVTVVAEQGAHAHEHH
jgi:hypothetical protein